MAISDPVERNAKRDTSPLERYVRQLLREARWVQEATEAPRRDQAPVADALRQQAPAAGD